MSFLIHSHNKMSAATLTAVISICPHKPPNYTDRQPPYLRIRSVCKTCHMQGQSKVPGDFDHPLRPIPSCVRQPLSNLNFNPQRTFITPSFVSTADWSAVLGWQKLNIEENSHVNIQWIWFPPTGNSDKERQMTLPKETIGVSWDPISSHTS